MVQGQSGLWPGTPRDPPARQLGPHGLPEQRRWSRAVGTLAGYPGGPPVPIAEVPRAT